MKTDSFVDPDCPPDHKFLVQFRDAKTAEDAIAEAIQMFGVRFSKNPLDYAVREGIYLRGKERDAQGNIVMEKRPEGRRVYLKLRREP